MSSLLMKNVYSMKKSNLNGVSLFEYTRLVLRCKEFSKNRKTHTTVDVEEVAKHSRLMDEWWDLRGPMSALHAMNEIRVPFVRDGMIQVSPNERTKTPLRGKKILDVGCGGGILSEPLAALGAEVTGIDASKELIELAMRHSDMNKKLANNKPIYYQTSVEDHASKYESYYDGVVASEIIEHVANKEVFVDYCVKPLKPGGRIFFTTPNRTRLTQFAGIFLAEYVFNIVPKGTHQYDKLTTPNELSFLLERSNCHVESIYGCYYNMIQNKWYFIRNTSLLFALQAVKLK